MGKATSLDSILPRRKDFATVFVPDTRRQISFIVSDHISPGENIDDSAALLPVCVVRVCVEHCVCRNFVCSGPRTPTARCAAGGEDPGADEQRWRFDC